MNFIKALTGRNCNVSSIKAHEVTDLESISSLLEKNGFVVIQGKPRNLVSLEKEGMFNRESIRCCRFAVLAGSFEKINVAIPLVSRRVVASALSQLYLHKGKSFKNKILLNVLRVFNWPFLYNKLFKKQFLVIVNLSRETLFSFLDSNLRSELIFSIYLTARKFCLPLFTKEGELFGFAKIYFPEEGRSYYGKNEASLLKRLEGIEFDKVSFPRVIFEGCFNECFVEVLSSAAGLKNFSTLTKRHLTCLKKLISKTRSKSPFENSYFYSQIEKEISFLKEKIPERFYLVEHFYNQAIVNLKDKSFVFSLTMREFPYFQILKHDEKLFVIDLEHARFDFPPIFDLYSLLLSLPRFKGDFVKVYQKELRHLFFSRNRKTFKYLEEMMEFLGLDSDNCYYFFWLFLIDQLYIHLSIGADLSGERVLNFFEKAFKDEKFFKTSWLNL